jgi:crotonobetainyl-CoA:carnitine CoA-transferase CaiB-like acyl-CoA transferase
MSGPLDGIRIVDLTAMASGPLATTILGDQGADVIKVEMPDKGDGLRRIGQSRGGMSGLFTSLNRNKRSIVLDLKQARGVELLDRLVAGADLFVQNFRPGAVDRLGVGPKRYCELHPELVYVSMSGFGEVGPMAGHAVYDSLMQAYSGYAMHQADPDTGEPTFVRNVICDKGTAVQTSQLITAALLARERGRGGQHLRVSMLHASLAFLWPDGMQNHTLLGPDVSAPLTKGALPVIRPTRDGFISISYIQDHEYQAFCRAIERPDLADDERFVEAGPRARNQRLLQSTVEDNLRSFATAELIERLEREAVPYSSIGDPATIHLDPQVIANNLLFEMDHPAVGRLRQPRPLGDFETTPTDACRPAPSLGEHSEEIAREAGLGEEEVASLLEVGVIRSPRHR